MRVEFYGVADMLSQETTKIIASQRKDLAPSIAKIWDDGMIPSLALHTASLATGDPTKIPMSCRHIIAALANHAMMLICREIAEKDQAEAN